MINTLVTPDTDLGEIKIEALRDHIVISYVAGYCNHCLRMRPVIDKVSLQFDRLKDKVIFNRFDLDENDIDFLDFDKVPKVIFYPKGIKEQGVELTVFDEKMRTLDMKIV